MMNITTKTGGSKYTASAEAVTSSFTDDYGYNIYDMTLSGPLYPAWKGQTFFALRPQNFQQLFFVEK